jgi:hypothetical protein
MVVVRHIAEVLHILLRELEIRTAEVGELHTVPQEVDHMEAAEEGTVVGHIDLGARRTAAGQVDRMEAVEEDTVADHMELEPVRHKLAVAADILEEAVGHKLVVQEVDHMLAVEEGDIVRMPVEGNLFIISACFQLNHMYLRPCGGAPGGAPYGC